MCHHQVYVYMITSCPKIRKASLSYTKGQDESMKSRCEGYSRPHTYHMDLPVETAEEDAAADHKGSVVGGGGVTYANIFCAYCHGETVDTLKPFTADISCNNMDIIAECGFSIEEDILTHEYYVRGALK